MEPFAARAGETAMLRRAATAATRARRIRAPMVRVCMVCDIDSVCELTSCVLGFCVGAVGERCAMRSPRRGVVLREFLRGGCASTACEYTRQQRGTGPFRADGSLLAGLWSGRADRS